MNGGRHIAILIGNSEFPEEPSLSALRCPQRDVEGLAAALTAQETGLFADPLIFINEPHHKVLPAINRVFKQASRQDQILVYYSGHGKQDSAGRLHLATADTEADALETTSIAVDSFRQLIDNYACKQVALILDCCFGGLAGKDFLKGGVDDQLQQVGRGIYVLTASTATQTAREKDGDEYSLLTKHILHGLAHGEADQDDDGLVSMDDLYEYVRARVPREAPQHPMKWALGIQGGEFAIARAVKIYSLEQLRAFRELIKSLDSYLPEEVFDQAIQVIRAKQPKQDKEFLSLLEALSENRAGVGEFVSRWYRLGLPFSLQQQRELVAQGQRELEEPRLAEAARQAEEQGQFELEVQRLAEAARQAEEQGQFELEVQSLAEAVCQAEEQRQRKLEAPRSFRFILRELSSLAVIYFVVWLLWLLWSLRQGLESYIKFLAWMEAPLMIVFNVIAFLFTLYHTITWFNPVPKAMPVRVGGKSNEPFLWSPFSAGGMIAALMVPVLLLLFGLTFPLGWVVAPSYSSLLTLARPPLARLALFAICSLPLFHSAHRFRLTLYHGLQIKHLNELIAIFCYGGAVVGAALAAYILWTMY
jgi:fumarate reductase subunit D